MKMKVCLISMSGVRLATKELKELGLTMPQFSNRGNVVKSLPGLGLLTVAALTPDDVEVVYKEIDDMPSIDQPLEDCDLVGFSSLTARINDTYELAARYRAAGIPVVLGGLHVTMNPEEATQHADSIVMYGAEGAWPKLIEAFRAGQMQPRYEGLQADVFDDENYVMPRFDLLEGRQYNRLTVQTSRGCPLNCEFCSASIRLTSSFQQKPVDKVIAEIEEALKYSDHRFFEFSDDNTFTNKRWGKEFLRAIIPLNITWFGMTDVSVADDDELLELLSRSGCVQILIGFESPDEENIASINKSDWKKKRVPTYKEAIRKIQSYGVTVSGCFVMGLDGQKPDIFEKVRDFIRESQLLEAQLTVMTPFPGTPLYDRLKAEGRLLEDEFWDRCTLFDLNFKPTDMTGEQLKDGMLWLFKEVYNNEQFLLRKRHYMDILKARMDEAEQN